MKKITLNTMLYFLSGMVLLSCSNNGTGSRIQDKGSPQKSFGEYALLKPGACDTDIKIWKIGKQTTEKKIVKITKSGGSTVKIQGLVRDKIESNSGIALFADVSGYRYKAVTGIATSTIPKYPKAGYVFEIPKNKLERGRQSVTFYLIKTEAKAYCAITGELTLYIE